MLGYCKARRWETDRASQRALCTLQPALDPRRSPSAPIGVHCPGLVVCRARLVVLRTGTTMVSGVSGETWAACEPLFRETHQCPVSPTAAGEARPHSSAVGSVRGSAARGKLLLRVAGHPVRARGGLLRPPGRAAPFLADVCAHSTQALAFTATSEVCRVSTAADRRQWPSIPTEDREHSPHQQAFRDSPPLQPR